MRRDTVFALGLALALTGVGAWALDSQGAGSAAGEGAQLQAPAPANPNPTAQDNQAQPNAAPPNAAQTNPAAPDQTQVNPAQPNQPSPNQAQPNAAQPAPAQPNPAQPAPAPSSVPGQTGTTTAPVYYSPLQEFASHQVDEIGELSRELDQFKAAKRPDAVMALYHMIRDHRLLADAAANVLARRGDVAAPTITVTPAVANTPAEMIRQDIQEHQQAATNLQQLVSGANASEDRNLYQQALNATNKHLQWLQALDQGQQVAVGFFDPTTPLGQLSGAATVATASATGYPQPVISRTAGFQQQIAPRRTPRHRRFRHGRYARYGRRGRSSRMSRYR